MRRKLSVQLLLLSFLKYHRAHLRETSLGEKSQKWSVAKNNWFLHHIHPEKTVCLLVQTQGHVHRRLLEVLQLRIQGFTPTTKTHLPKCQIVPSTITLSAPPMVLRQNPSLTVTAGRCCSTTRGAAPRQALCGEEPDWKNFFSWLTKSQSQTWSHLGAETINTLALKSSEEYLGGPFPEAWVVPRSVYTGTAV